MFDRYKQERSYTYTNNFIFLWMDFTSSFSVQTHLLQNIIRPKTGSLLRHLHTPLFLLNHGLFTWLTPLLHHLLNLFINLLKIKIHIFFRLLLIWVTLYRLAMRITILHKLWDLLARNGWTSKWNNRWKMRRRSDILLFVWKIWFLLVVTVV